MRTRLFLTWLIGLCVLGAWCSAVEGSPWVEQLKLVAGDPSYTAACGDSVAIDGDTIVLGAPLDSVTGGRTGAAYFFRDTGATWEEVCKVTASDGDTTDYFGTAVSISGSYAILGAPEDSDNGYDSGSAYVFQDSGSVWVEVDKLRASDASAYENFGSAVAMDGSRAIIGARGAWTLGPGAAYIFENNGGTWTQTAKLKASDGATGDAFGRSVGICGDYAIVGAHQDDDCGFRTGSAYVYRFTANGWEEAAKLTPLHRHADQWFGYSVDICNGLAVVGANGDNETGEFSGAAYLFKEVPDTWLQFKLRPSDPTAYKHFGWSVALDGSTVVVGAIRDYEGGYEAGAAYVFLDNGPTWVQVQKLIASDAQADDWSGWSVDIDGDHILVGSPENDNPQVIRPGDANADTKIDGGDLAIWQTNYDPLGTGGPYTFFDGDFNGDGKIDGGDLALWQTHYDPLGLEDSGAAYVFDEVFLSTAEGVEPIPEPGSVLLVTAGSLVLLRIRRASRAQKEG